MTEYRIAVSDLDGDLTYVYTERQPAHDSRLVVVTSTGYFNAEQARDYAALILEAADTLAVVDEPRNFGAIVAEKGGRRWLRSDDSSMSWRSADGGWAEWSDLDHPTVQFEGIPE